MMKIRKIEISNFRSVRSLSWLPNEGFNCLVGPGDSGKTSILEAIDLCLTPRRAVRITDVDFTDCDTTQAISIRVTIGSLPDVFENIELYSNFHRGIATDGKISDEPGVGLETVVTVEFRVESDLEPIWQLYSERAAADGALRSIPWRDRQLITPTVITEAIGRDFSWSRGSALARIDSTELDVSAVVAESIRDLRSTFTEKANLTYQAARSTVDTLANKNGIDVGTGTVASIDPSALAPASGAVALHTSNGVPLACLGVGSTRLLLASMQRLTVQGSGLVVVDELENGLEPHRVMQLITVLSEKPSCQVFSASHSPVVVRELSAENLFVIRRSAAVTTVLPVPTSLQGPIRLNPEALLAKSLLVCEGATEVGFIRGIDRTLPSPTNRRIAAHGVALLNAEGEKKLYNVALPFQSLGFRVAVLRDDDVPPQIDVEQKFVAEGGVVFKWQKDEAIEDAIFRCAPSDAISGLLDIAIEENEDKDIRQQILSASSAEFSLESLRTDASMRARSFLGTLSRKKSVSWYKSITKMQRVAETHIGPRIQTWAPEFKAVVDSIFAWLHK